MLLDWKVFGTTFAMLFLAEVGDKTQLAVISITCKTAKPITVFTASVLALAAVTLIGVLFGEGIAAAVPKIWIKRGSALLFFVVGILIFLDIL